MGDLAKTREDDDVVHPKAVEREETARASLLATLYSLITATVLGLVSLYPIIRGTRTDNHTMLLIGCFVAAVSFKVLPLSDAVGLVRAWRGRDQ